MRGVRTCVKASIWDDVAPPQVRVCCISQPSWNCTTWKCTCALRTLSVDSLYYTAVSCCSVSVSGTAARSAHGWRLAEDCIPDEPAAMQSHPRQDAKCFVG